MTRARTAAAGVALAVVAALGGTTPAGAADTTGRCAALAGVEVPARVIGLPATRTRPLCEYPAHPGYSGTGSPDEAGSFTCGKG